MPATAVKSSSVGVRPLADHVLVFADEADDRTPGGIVLPEQAKERPQRGTLVAVGPGRIADSGLIACRVKVGEKVLYGKYAGSDFEVNGVEYRMMRESDLLAVIE